MTVEVLDRDEVVAVFQDAPEPDEPARPPAVRLTALRSPFSFAREELALDAGPTIADLLAQLGIRTARVWVGDVEVPPDWFARVRPRPGATVTIRAVARGGSGQNIGKLVGGVVLSIVGVLMIALGATTFIYGGFTVSMAGWYVLGLGVSLALSGLINLLIPVPSPKLKPLSGILGSQSSPESPTLSVSGNQNALHPYAPVPVVLGRHRVFPPYAAMPFTEAVGADQYLRLLFNLTYGPCLISDLKLGDTALANFQAVETEFIQGAVGQPHSKLYAVDVFEDPLSVLLTQAGGRQVRTSQPGAVELSVDGVFPEGLVAFDANGTKSPVTVQFDVEYRLVGTTDFLLVVGSPVITTEARQGLVRVGMRWKPQQPIGTTPAASWRAFGLASFDAAKINDGVLNVLAFDADAAAVGSWIFFDSGVGITNEFGRVTVTSAGTGANATWDVRYSNDGVTWFTVFSGFSTGAAASQTASWTPDGAHRYWLLFKTNGAVAGPDYYEVAWWRTTAGQYDVGLTRITADNADPLVKNVLVWSALRSIGSTPPVLLDNVSLLAMRIKATDQLNGVVGDFNCIVESLIPDYATYAGSVLADAPLGYWRLGEPLDAPTAFDASGNARSGVYGGLPVLGAAGLVTDDADTAMLCDGSNDSVTAFTGLTAIDMGGMSFTIELTFNPANVTGDKGIAGKGTIQYTGGGFGWSLLQSGTTLRFARTTATFITATVAAGVRYHVVATYNILTGVAALWVNGTVASTATWSTTPYADAYGLRLASGDYGLFAGTLDEVAIYPGVALSNARIAAHYAASTGTREWVVQRTSNPASHFRYILQGLANARPLPDARLDLPAIQAWHAENSVGGRSCNLVVDYETTVYELLRAVAACGRATVTMNDDKYAPVRDLPQTVPAQHFTQRNSRGWSGARVLPETVHGVKVRFVNPAASWRQDERIVYDDGYSAANATRFTVLELHGVTDPDLAWRLGRYHLAVTRLRPEVYTLETDIEALVCRRGDLVRVTHDVVEFGLAAGRIKSVTSGGGFATAITTDEVMPMVGDKSYAARIRLSDGTSRLAPVLTVAGDQTALTFTDPFAAPLPAVGDLIMFGLVGRESVECLVARITPSPDFMARLNLIDYAPGVQAADQGPIPPYESHITTQAPNERVPPTPVIDSAISDETVLIRDLDGSLTSRVLMSLHYVATSNVRADGVEVRWRRVGSAGPYGTLPGLLPPDATTISVVPVEDGVAYDIRVRTVNGDGSTSPWAELFNYVVVGKTSRPPAPINLRIEGTRLTWDYPTPPLDFNDGFEVRRSPGATGNWDTALELHQGLVFSPYDLPPGLMYYQWTFMVAAVDTSGNVSDRASLTVDFGTPPIHNQVATQNYHTAFPGSITNGSVIANHLVADQLTTGFWTQDGNLFWSASGATLFWLGSYKEMTYDFSYTTGANAGGCTLIFTALTLVASGWRLLYRVGAAGDYLPWPGALPGLLPSQEYDFRLITDASQVQGDVSAITLVVDAPDLEELHGNFATAVTTGTRLTLAHTFRTIKSVEATVLAAGGETAITAIAADQQNTAGANNGPLIKSYDAGGAVVAGHVNAVVKGF